MYDTNDKTNNIDDDNNDDTTPIANNNKIIMKISIPSDNYMYIWQILY